MKKSKQQTAKSRQHHCVSIGDVAKSMRLYFHVLKSERVPNSRMKCKKELFCIGRHLRSEIKKYLSETEHDIRQILAYMRMRYISHRKRYRCVRKQPGRCEFCIFRIVIVINLWVPAMAIEPAPLYLLQTTFVQIDLYRSIF